MDYDSDHTYCSFLETDRFSPSTNQNYDPSVHQEEENGWLRRSQRIVTKVVNYCDAKRNRIKFQKEAKTKIRKGKERSKIDLQTKRGRPKNEIKKKRGRPKVDSIKKADQCNRRKYTNENLVDKKILLIKKCMWKCKDIITQNIFDCLELEKTLLKDIYLKLNEILKKSQDLIENLEKENLETGYNKIISKNFEMLKTELIQRSTVTSILKKIQKSTEEFQKDGTHLKEINKIKSTMMNKSNNEFDQYFKFKNISSDGILINNNLFCLQPVKKFIENSIQNNIEKSQPNEEILCNAKNIPESQVISKNILSQDIFDSPQMTQNNVDYSENDEYLSCIEKTQAENLVSQYSKKSVKTAQISDEIDFSQKTICYDESQQNSEYVTQHTNKTDMNIKSQDSFLNVNHTYNKMNINNEYNVLRNITNSKFSTNVNKNPVEHNYSKKPNDQNNFNENIPYSSTCSQNAKQQEASVNDTTIKLIENIHANKEKYLSDYGWLKSIKTVPSHTSNSDKCVQKIVLPKEFWENPYAEIPKNWLDDFND